MTASSIILGILGLALLMVVHEAGHHFAARAFGMRVIRFSIGFGPAIWKHQPKGSPTVYQIALIPFLAYVQIAGMNPLEEVDPNDKGSYANASLIGRITTIFAGPFANYAFASVLFFAANMISGEPVKTMHVDVLPDGAAKSADLRSGDLIKGIEGKPITKFEELRKVVVANPEKPLKFTVERDGKELVLPVTPKRSKAGTGFIGVTLMTQAMPTKKALKLSIKQPATVVQMFVVGMARIISGKEKPEFKGPPGIVKEVGKAADRGWGQLLGFLGLLSAYIGAFNLLPIPALDGGRLMFLGYEAVTRHRPNAKVEANVHAIGLLLMLTLIAIVSVYDLRGP